MTKPLPRRAREYFEVLDDLKAQGFVSHEEWQYLDSGNQGTIPKMTMRLVEDTLMEYGYSKGCSNEQKKYRTLWLKERGILADGGKSISHSSDPIIGAVEAFRTQIRREEQLRADQAIERADTKVTEIREAYNGVVVELKERTNSFDSLQQQYTVLEHELQKTTDELIHTQQRLTNIQVRLAEVEKGAQSKELKQESHHKEMMELNQKTMTSLRSDLKSLTEKQVKEIKIIESNAEQLRVKLMAETDRLREDNNNLDRQNHKLLGIDQQSKEAMKDLRSQLQAAQTENSRVRSELKTVNTNLNDAVRKHVALSTSARELEEQYKTKKKDCEKLQEGLLEAKEKTGNLEGRLQILKKSQSIKKKDAKER